MSRTVDGLLADLQRRGVQLTAQEGRLRLNAPKGVLTPELLKMLEAAKPALLAALADAPREALRPLARVSPDDRLPPSFEQGRAALPRPDTPPPEVRGSHAPPDGALEETLTGLWREVLEIDRVGLDDNFFDLGGHSLRMARLHTRVREIFGCEITLLELLQSPTVRDMARRLERGRETRAPSFAEVSQRAEQAHDALQRQHKPVE